jgi:hypothetical protein
MTPLTQRRFARQSPGPTCGSCQPRPPSSRAAWCSLTGESATFRIAQQVADALEVEVHPKLRVADAISIDRSGISNEEYSYALKAHFDVLVVRDNLPVLAIEFGGAGHDPKNDHLKNRLCDRFELPLVRVGMVHINSKNFEDWQSIS